MGTRSLTFLYDEKAEPFTCFYRQYDGYPSGHGLELAEILTGGKLVNGIGRDTNVFNGMGCLAAQIIMRLKDGPGGIYIERPTLEDAGQDFEYHIYTDSVTVKGYNGDILFEGTWEEFYNFCAEEEIA